MISYSKFRNFEISEKFLLEEISIFQLQINKNSEFLAQKHDHSKSMPEISSFRFTMAVRSIGTQKLFDFAFIHSFTENKLAGKITIP
jgi:CRISPR/Cas system-associated protein endoribonuclease Cas2